MNAFGAELLKARTTRLLLWYVLALAGFLVLVVSIHVGTATQVDLHSSSSQRGLLAVAGLSAIVTVLVGGLLLTGEYNHGTINQSFLAVPNRLRLMLAKLAAAVLVGAAFGLLADGLILLLAAVWFAGRGASLHLGHGVATPLLGAAAAATLAAAIGLGFGAIVRRQTATIVLVLLWLLIGENVVAISPHTVRFAPGHVIAAIVLGHRGGASDRLGVWPAVAVALLYAAVFCAAGFALVMRTDAPTTGQ